LFLWAVALEPGRSAGDQWSEIVTFPQLEATVSVGVRTDFVDAAAQVMLSDSPS
jgi:hypothetical protein